MAVKPRLGFLRLLLAGIVGVLMGMAIQGVSDVWGFRARIDATIAQSDDDQEGADTYSQAADPQPLAKPAVPPSSVSPSVSPDYRIEPPDILKIDMPPVTPVQPYKAEVFDVLEVRVANAPANSPIDGHFMVGSEGVLNLGPSYGSVRVAGMSAEQMTQAVTKHLRPSVQAPLVTVKFARTAGEEPVTGQYLVGPDGTINLRQYGVVRVAGMTTAEARTAVQKRLAASFDSSKLTLDVLTYDSKVYYVITGGTGLSADVRRFPVTGSETVLDAICQLQGLSRLSSKKIWIARPSPNHQFGCETVLPVDWDAITRGARTETNYWILPGDRVFILGPPELARSLGALVLQQCQPFVQALNDCIEAVAECKTLAGTTRHSPPPAAWRLESAQGETEQMRQWEFSDKARQIERDLGIK